MFNWFKNIGPGTLIAAAFIGPGTVTLCTIAGVNFGYTLLWAMLLSIIATIVLQEMSARLGTISQKDLSTIIREEINHPLLKTLTLLLILSAIVIGNAAYEAGNISGGVLGLETLIGEQVIKVGTSSFNYLSIILGLIAFIILYIGNYKFIEKALVSLVIIMSISFLITAIITQPNIFQIIKGMFVPQLPKGSLLTVIGLIGTTVVPYNLFLHASLAKEKWKTSEDLDKAKKDTFISIILGGLVSMSIIISASNIDTTNIKNASDLALSLEPLFGNFAKYMLGVGLFSAGITSAITAPLAAAYVANGCLGWNAEMKSFKFRAVWMFILVLGIVISSFGFKPIEIIKFAQIANGILLPVIAAVLIRFMNKKDLLGNFRNTSMQNIIGVLILIITIFLGLKSILKVIEFI